MNETYYGPYNSKDMFNITLEAIRDSLNPVFSKIRDAAVRGDDYVDISDDLIEDQIWLLEKYEYSVLENDRDNTPGFPWHISWFKEDID